MQTLHFTSLPLALIFANRHSGTCDCPLSFENSAHGMETVAFKLKCLTSYFIPATVDTITKYQHYSMLLLLLNCTQPWYLYLPECNSFERRNAARRREVHLDHCCIGDLFVSAKIFALVFPHDLLHCRTSFMAYESNGVYTACPML